MSDHIRSVTQSVAGVHRHEGSSPMEEARCRSTAFIISRGSRSAPPRWVRPRSISGKGRCRHATFSDILLLFIYLEIGPMVGI